MNTKLRSFALTLLTLALATAAVAQPANPPRVSPMATTSQVVGVSEVSITYSRPSVKGRTIWGELVPWDQVWRTGANEATTFTVSDDASVGGKKLPAGTYALFTIPGKDAWTVIFNKEAQQLGAFQYKEAEDALRITVRPQKAPFAEQLAIGFSEVSSDSAKVTVHWEETTVPFTVAFDTPEIAYARAQGSIAGILDSGSISQQDGQAIYGWCQYFLQQGSHLTEALGWIRRMAEGTDIYWVHALKARIEAANGKHAEAAATAAKALELGKAAVASNAPGASFMKTDMEGLEGEVKEWAGGE